MANVLISDLTAATEADALDLLELETAGGASRKITIATPRTVTDTDTSFAGAIEDTARLGYCKNSMAPSGNSTNISFASVDWTEVDTTSGNITGAGHGGATMSYMSFKGSGTVAQSFIHESKLKTDDTVDLTSLSFYKLSTDSIATGSVITSLKGLDCEMDLSGIDGTVTTAYSIYSPDTDKILLNNGGLITDSVTLVDDYTLDDNDSGNHFLMFAGTTKTVTAPTTLSDGFTCSVMQGDANQVTVAASGGNTIFNKESHTKTEKLYAVVTITQYTSTVTSLNGETGA